LIVIIARESRKASSIVRRSSAAVSLIFAATASAMLAAPTAAKDEAVSLPEPVIGLPATTKRKEPREVVLDGARYQHFVITVTSSESGEFFSRIDLVTYVNCRTNQTVIVWSQGYGNNKELGIYTFPPIVERELKPQDETKANAEIGQRNLEFMCNLK
jgi:hypothetical protein